MIRIETVLIGQPQELHDERGTWRSAIYRQPVTGPVGLGPRGLAGDRVANRRYHGSPDQAVCCHPLAHYEYWNTVYGLDTPDLQLGPGSVGENWTLSGVTEADVCVGDVYAVGTARVQVSSPRYPCVNQERKLRLPGFLHRTTATLRTGFYVRVLTPGFVAAGDEWHLEARPQPEITVQRINECAHHQMDPEFARVAVDVPELAAGWKRIIQRRLDRSGS